MSFRFIFVYVVVLAYVTITNGATTPTAHPTTPAELLSYLRSIEGKHTISGQFIELGPLDPITDIHKTTGKWLGLIGGDYWHFGGTGYNADYAPFNNNAVAYWQAGGLITLTCSMPNPTTGGYSGDLSKLNATALFTTGTPSNNNFNTMLSSIAAGIAQLQKAGVVVIFRPFHELNGNWFWWGTTFLSSQQFIDMWQYMHNYFTNTMGLHNIVWLYAINTGVGGDLTRYPGSTYVDIVGQDLYTNNPAQGQADYKTLLGLGKPVCLAEFGPGGPSAGDRSFNETTLISAIKNTMPSTVLWQQWWDGNAGKTGWGMAEVQGASLALNDAWVLNRGDF